MYVRTYTIDPLYPIANCDASPDRTEAKNDFPENFATGPGESNKLLSQPTGVQQRNTSIKKSEEKEEVASSSPLLAQDQTDPNSVAASDTFDQIDQKTVIFSHARDDDTADGSDELREILDRRQDPLNRDILETEGAVLERNVGFGGGGVDDNPTRRSSGKIDTCPGKLACA